MEETKQKYEKPTMKVYRLKQRPQLLVESLGNKRQDYILINLDENLAKDGTSGHDATVPAVHLVHSLGHGFHHRRDGDRWKCDRSDQQDDLPPVARMDKD